MKYNNPSSDLELLLALQSQLVSIEAPRNLKYLNAHKLMQSKQSAKSPIKIKNRTAQVFKKKSSMDADGVPMMIPTRKGLSEV